MLRQPPIPTLFPYTTLFRSRHQNSFTRCGGPAPKAPSRSVPALGGAASPLPWRRARERIRSEEHTSELQSHSDLVCRLLLEKKKKHNQRRIPQTRRHLSGTI